MYMLQNMRKDRFKQLSYRCKTLKNIKKIYKWVTVMRVSLWCESLFTLDFAFIILE